MLWSNKKGEEGSPWGAIFAAVLGLIFLATFIGVLVAVQTDALNEETAAQTGCWLTYSLQCGGGIFSSISSLCSLEIIEDPINTEKLADLTRATWWMFKEGSCDLDIVEDDLYLAYSFTPIEDISIPAFMDYLAKNNRGNPIDKVENSDYAYLETNTPEPTLCFNSKSTGIEQDILVAGEIYYLIFYDDVSFVGEEYISEPSDALLISNDPDFDKGHFEDIIAASGTPLAGYYWTRTGEERGCAFYNPYGGSPNA